MFWIIMTIMTTTRSRRIRSRRRWRRRRGRGAVPGVQWRWWPERMKTTTTRKRRRKESQDEWLKRAFTKIEGLVANRHDHDEHWQSYSKIHQVRWPLMATIYTHYTPSWTYLNPACDGRILVWQQGQLLMVLDGRNPTKMLKPVATWRSRLKMLKHVQHDKEDFPYLVYIYIYMYHVHKCTYLYTFHSSRHAISFLGLTEGWNKTKEVPEEAQPSSASKYLP